MRRSTFHTGNAAADTRVGGPIVARTLVVSILALAACGGDSGAAGSGSDGPPEWTVELVQEIGSVDDPEQTLTRIGDVALGPDGTLYIGQPDDAYVRVHADDGAFIRTIGRRGEGPGEFRGPGSIAVDATGLWIADRGNARMARFTLDGTLVEEERWPTVNVNDDPAIYVYGAGEDRRTPDGRAMSLPGMVVRAMQSGPAPELGAMPIRWFGPDGELGDTVVALSGAYKTGAPSGSFPGMTGAPFFELMRDGDGVAWVVRNPADTEDEGFFVARVDAAGDTLFARRYAYEPIPTPADEIVREVVERVNPRTLERVNGQIWVPSSYPAVSALTATSSGDLWIAREEGQDPTPWWVLDAENGAHVATVQLPEGEEVVDVRGDVLVTKRTDGFDVPYVRRYRVVR